MELIGKGLTAKVYKLDEYTVLKFFNENYPEEAVKREYSNACFINDCGIRAVLACQLMEHKNRLGIVYFYVKGQLLEKVFDSKVNLQHYLTEFCNLQKSFYNQHNSDLLIYKEYGIILVNSRLQNQNEKKDALDFTKSFPDSDTLVHDDYHPRNVFVCQARIRTLRL